MIKWWYFSFRFYFLFESCQKKTEDTLKLSANRIDSNLFRKPFSNFPMGKIKLEGDGDGTYSVIA